MAQIKLVITADNTGASTAISEVDKELSALGAKKIEIKLDRVKALGTIGKVSAALHKLDNRKIAIQVDNSAAMKTVNAVNAELNKINNKTFDIKVDSSAASNLQNASTQAQKLSSSLAKMQSTMMPSGDITHRVETYNNGLGKTLQITKYLDKETGTLEETSRKITTNYEEQRKAAEKVQKQQDDMWRSYASWQEKAAQKQTDSAFATYERDYAKEEAEAEKLAAREIALDEKVTQQAEQNAARRAKASVEAYQASFERATQGVVQLRGAFADLQSSISNKVSLFPEGTFDQISSQVSELSLIHI